MSFENGKLTSSSIWFIPPPSKILILDMATPVQYSVDVPPIDQIVLHSGVSFLAHLGEEQGTWAQAGYAYKPMNQLLLAYEGKLQLGTNVALATVHPRVLYHELISAEAGYTSNLFRGWLSALSDRPIRDQTPESWTTQEVASALSLSPSVEYRFGSSAEKSPVLGLSYLRVWGGNAPDGGIGTGATGDNSGSVFDTRYPYTNALIMSLHSSLAPLGGIAQQMQASTRFLQDFDHSGTILSMELTYHPQETWAFSLGADVLGSNSTSNSLSAGSDFISRYQSNDRVHLGVSHAF